MSSRAKQILSVIITFTIYTLWIGWKASLLLCVAVAFHEQCHLWGAKKMGLKPHMWILIPFIGGVSLVSGRIRERAQTAFYVLAGPMGGGVLGLLTAEAFFLTGGHIAWLGSAAFWMLFLNAFNLLPLSLLDGGQIMGTITYSINRTLGVACLTASTALAIVGLSFISPILGVFIALFGGLSVYKEIKNWLAYRRDQWFLCTDEWIYPPKKLTHKQMAMTIVCWIGSAAMFFVVMSIIAVRYHYAVGYFFNR